MDDTELKITTKVNPVILNELIKDTVLALEKKCGVRKDYHLGDGILRVDIKWMKSKSTRTVN